MTKAEQLLSKIATQHSSQLPQSVVDDIKELLGLAGRKDPWSRFLCLPGSGTRAALGKIAREYGAPTVNRAVDKLLARPPPAAAMAKLITMCKGADDVDTVDMVGNVLPPAR